MLNEWVIEEWAFFSNDYNSVSIAWMTPFVAGIFDVIICDSLTLILPAKNFYFVNSIQTENGSMSLTSASLLQCNGFTSC